jgi:hypothetical protein
MKAQPRHTMSAVPTILILTDNPNDARVQAVQEDLGARGARVEHLPPFAGVDMERWAAALERDYDAVVVVAVSRSMDSTPLGLAFIDAAKARLRTGRPKLFLSLPNNAILPWLYSQGAPVLLPEAPLEAVATMLDALK